VVVRVTPAVGLYDQARTIVISHLAAGRLVSVTATSRRSDGVWSARATFKAASGLVDLARDAPVSGSYRGVSPMGLFWSEHRVGPGSASPGVTSTTIAVSAASRRLVSGHVTQLLSGPGVTEHVERGATAGFYGEYFAPPGSGRRPAVVVWGGSERGLSEGPSMAALLASHGIPALALAYFDEPGLPCSLSNIPLEYFARAIRWLGSQPEVDRGRVWAMSGSRGSEAALLVASHWPQLVHGVVVSAPSSEIYGSIEGQCSTTAPAAWTLDGAPLPHAYVAVSDVVYQPDGSASGSAGVPGRAGRRRSGSGRPDPGAADQGACAADQRW